MCFRMYTTMLCVSPPCCCVFQGVHHVVCFRVYATMLCVLECTPPCCVFPGVHYHVVCFQVYTTMLVCVLGCTLCSKCCVFQGGHHVVCFRAYTIMLCVSGCTPCCVFQSVHHHVVVCFRVYTTMLGKKASLAPLKEILRRHKVSGNWCRLALNPLALLQVKKKSPTTVSFISNQLFPTWFARCMCVCVCEREREKGNCGEG